MDSFSTDGYVPILLTKLGERSALHNSSPAVKSRINPLFVVHPIDWDFDADAPKKGVDNHLADLPNQLVDCWGTAPAFIDLILIDDVPMSNGQHPLEWFTERASRRGLNLVPAVSTDRSAAYVAAAAAVVRRDGDGANFRLPIRAWPSATGVTSLNQLMSAVGVRPADVHLLLDLGDEVGAAARTAAAAELRSLPYLNDWRSVTVAGTGIPSTMPPGNGLHVIPRGEWHIYQALLHPSAPLPRVPTFGDYAVAHPDPVADVNPRFMNISATLRYTVSEDWLVAKGGLFKASGGRSLGGAAVPPAARLLAAHPEFYGAAHCDFDQWVEAVATQSPNGGNATVWRRFGTQHHLQVVTDQIATLAGTSVAP